MPTRSRVPAPGAPTSAPGDLGAGPATGAPAPTSGVPTSAAGVPTAASAGPAAARPPRRQPPDVRREQILDAAERVLVARGLAAATMAEVAEAAAVAKGTVYLYFDSKAELLAGLRARYFERLTAMLGEPPGPGRPGEATAARVERLVAASYDFAVANHQLHHVLFHEAGFGKADAFTRVRAVIADLIEAGRAGGELRAADPDLATDFLLHGLHGVLVAAIHRPPPPRERLVAGLTEMMCRALGIKPSAGTRSARGPGAGPKGRGEGRARGHRR